MECPFLIVKEDGRWAYKYYCKAQRGAQIGDTNNKYLVENKCRKAYQNCDSYKHPRT